MTCREYQELFAEAYYRELAPDVQAALDGHLSACPGCRTAYQRMRETLELMSQRPHHQADEKFLSGFWESVRARIEAGEPGTGVRLRRKMPFRPASLPGWAFAAAAAVILAVGIYLGKELFVPAPSRPAPAVAESPAADSTGKRVDEYLDRSRVLLLGLVNAPGETPPPSILGEQQRVARQLLRQGSVLRASLKEPDQAQLRRLIGDLEIVLMQLANYSIDNRVPLIEIVRQGVDQKSILLKINLEELQRAVGRTPVRPAARSDHGKAGT